MHGARSLPLFPDGNLNMRLQTVRKLDKNAPARLLKKQWQVSKVLFSCVDFTFQHLSHHRRGVNFG